MQDLKTSKTSDIEIYEDVDPNLAKIFHRNTNDTNQVFVVDETAKNVDAKDTQNQSNNTQNPNKGTHVSKHRNHYVVHPFNTGKPTNSMLADWFAGKNLR